MKKYILNEFDKYILKEKNILAEKYILNEAPENNNSENDDSESNNKAINQYQIRKVTAEVNKAIANLDSRYAPTLIIDKLIANVQDLKTPYKSLTDFYTLTLSKIVSEFEKADKTISNNVEDSDKRSNLGTIAGQYIEAIRDTKIDIDNTQYTVVDFWTTHTAGKRLSNNWEALGKAVNVVVNNSTPINDNNTTINAEYLDYIKNLPKTFAAVNKEFKEFCYLPKVAINGQISTSALDTAIDNLNKLKDPIYVNLRKFLADDIQKNVFGDKDSSVYYKNWAGYASPRDAELTGINLIKKLYEYCRAISTLPTVVPASPITAANFTASSKEIANKVATLTEIITTIQNWNEAVLELCNLIEVRGGVDSSISQSDWESRFREAEQSKNNYAIRKLLDDYYLTEWPQHTDKIKSFGAPFVQELLALGFTEKTNPFIAFINIAINAEFIQYIDGFKYGAIHNAYLYNYITKDDLRGKGTWDLNNVLFNQWMYQNIAATTILQYLEIEQQLRLTYRAVPQFKYPDLTNEYSGEDGLKKFMIDVFYEGGNPLTVAQGKERAAGNPRGGLKSITNIHDILARCLNNYEENTKVAPSYTNIITALNNSKAITSGIAYLYTIYGGNEDLSKILKQYQEFANFENVRFNLDETRRFQKIFKNYNITEQNIKVVLEKLCEEAADQGLLHKVS